MNKLFICVAILAITSSALGAEKVIGDWEGLTNEGWEDHQAMANAGWTQDIYVDDPTLMPSVYQWGDAWASSGYTSLETSVTGWGWKMRRYINADFMTYSKLEFDIYATPQAGSSATWAQVQQIAFSGKTNGWWTAAGSEFDIGMGTAMHCVLDFSAYHTSTYFNAGDYMSVVFALNAGAPVNFYIDDVKLVTPDPATMAFLGLGGLALLRRKK